MPSSVAARGFSTKTGTPASTPARTSGACPGVEVATTRVVETGADELVDADGLGDGEHRGHLGRPGRVGVGDDERLDAVEPGQRAGVERPDPSGSRESDPHPTSFVRTY